MKKVKMLFAESRQTWGEEDKLYQKMIVPKKKNKEEGFMRTFCGCAKRWTAGFVPPGIVAVM
ncbi:hypothetical protein ABS784_13425 [Geobacillus sp. G4]|uniref:Uncharacterized protein n=5 Tax=Geobacillus TaxID=129337 RepID=A0A7U9J9K8_GEOTM|nr:MULTISPECIES: hypothetical protein [Geobacillus]AJG38076.1 hypothetical protein [Geobacillus sp. enrichment culture clone fosmid MGS-MG1]AEV20931.1 hypothetical protein GTCCBUS3UF5_36300 [Geobacillus thermoleovorans CCB_US3_UF5]AMV12382.1 hypothetical protein GT3570_15825 [Geobacillus thermoleovorans]AOL35858.1 hypothetical protein BGM21_15925 [Geobacillus thermoleovorans]ASS98063.1 hypothetical protein GT3921_02730 [Geobacillus thermocatenulatus]